MLHRFRVITPLALAAQTVFFTLVIARNENIVNNEQSSSSSSNTDTHVSSSRAPSTKRAIVEKGKSTGTECHNPVCSSKMDMFQKSLLAHQNSGKTKANFSVKSDDPANTNSEPTVSKSIENQPDNRGNTNFSDVECPLDKEELGRASWSVIHTVAVHSPTSPTDAEQRHMAQFIESFAALYPCHVCAPEFQHYVRAHPPVTHSRAAFVLWCCHLHNYINEHLGKDVIKCDLQELDRRWKDGQPGCWTDASEVS